MRRSAIQSAICVGMAFGLSGCGGSPPPAPVKSIPGATVTIPSNNSSSTPTTATGPSTSATSKPKPKATEKRSIIPPNTDPRTIFAVNNIGERMEITSKAGLLPTDEYEVALADPRNDSTKFIVGSSQSSGASSQQLGGGQAKAGFNLPRGFTAVKESGYSAEGLPMRIFCTKTATTLAIVPGGPAIVGTDRGPDEAKPSFSVQLDTFYMEVLEVTVQSYEIFRAEMKEKKKSVPPNPANPSANPKNPVLGLPWAVAKEYAKWGGMELPTESEFEKAARGPNGLRTPWGEGKALWTNRTMSATGSYPTDSSPYGILDLAGNAREWCTDLYSPNGHTDAVAAAANGTLQNWPGPKKVKEMNLRVVKGNDPEWNSWHREGRDMGKVNQDVGFRCVLRIPPDPKTNTGTKSTSL